MGAQANRRPTLDQVALRAGVSRSVASRVINNTRDVSGDARDRAEDQQRQVLRGEGEPGVAQRAGGQQDVGRDRYGQQPGAKGADHAARPQQAEVS